MDSLDDLIDQLHLPGDSHILDYIEIASPSGEVVRVVNLGALGIEFESWELFDKSVAETGHSPVLIGPSDQLTAFGSEHYLHVDEFSCTREYRRTNGPSVAEILSKSQSIDPEKWFAKRQRKLTLRLGRTRLFPREKYTDGDPYCLHEPTASDFYLALVPTRESWKIPAYLPFGDFGDCPSPEVHVAIWKYWHDLYGAKIQFMNRNTLDFQLDWIHEDDIDGEEGRDFKLARQGILYCPNVLSGKITSLDRVAAAVSCGQWKFCWQEPS